MPELPAFPQDPVGLAAFFEEHGRDRLPGLLGIQVVELAPGRAMLRLQIERKHLASNGYLHAGTIVALADTAAGYGTVASLPPQATGFTTLELKSNHTGTALSGAIVAAAGLTHGGRTTQVWDVTVSSEATGKDMALFRCTQMILYPGGG
ncbi:MAG TPA: PaaI family thioesterase, partial [Acidimicrobiia bacterium]|nr:PaaI family thioesterase [Acidimicrobiia bacterium]